MRTRKAQSEIAAGRRPACIVTITAPAGVIRVTDRPSGCAVEDTDADMTYQYVPGLFGEVDYEEDVDLFGLTARSALRSARLNVQLPDFDAAVSDAGHYGLLAARVEIAMIRGTETWQERTILIGGGQVTALQIGIGNQPTALTVESTPPETAVSVVDESRSMGDDFPSLGYTLLDGARWPVVIGKVYGVPGYKLGEVLVTFNASLGLCGHHLAPDIQLADLVVYEDGVSVSTAAMTLLNTTDSGGQIAVLYETSGGEFDISPATGAYTVDFTAGAYPCWRDDSKAASNAAEVLEVLLGLSEAAVDWEAMAPCLDYLRDLQIGVYLNDIRDGLTVIRDRLVPMLPIVEDASGTGVFFRFAAPELMPITTTLTYGQDLVGRISGVQYTDPGEVRNRFVVEYAYDSYTGRFASSVVVDGDNNELCRYSQQLFGVRTADTIRASCTWDESTARRIGVHAASRRALPRRVVSYLLDPSLFWLRAGTVVRWTDTEAGMTAQRAVVRSTAPFLNPPTITLESIDRAPSSAL